MISILKKLLKNSEWKSAEDYFEKELAYWIVKLLSYGD
jgi:hypothetical protein